MGLPGLIADLWSKTLGGTAPAGAASSTGDIGQMIKYITANVGGQTPRPWLPGRITSPIDVTIAGSTTLTERINYFNSLTINAGVIVTVANGPCILVVENTLTLGAGAKITADGLGGLGANPAASHVAVGGHVNGGKKNFSSSLVQEGLGLQGNTTIFAPTTPGEIIGGTGGNGPAAAGGAGGVPAAAALNGGGASGYAAYDALAAILAALAELGQWGFGGYDATIGGPGGGAGGLGGKANYASGTNAGGTNGSAGFGQASAGWGGGGGWYGGGGGGGGGSAASTTFSGTGQAGSGGGVIIILAKTINNAGSITANGTAATFSTPGTGCGGIGGGGGGMVGVLYESVTGSGVGTLQANGGANAAGGTGGGTAMAGAAGLAVSAKIRAGS